MWDFLGKSEKDDSRASRLDLKGDNIYRVPFMSKVYCCFSLISYPDLNSVCIVSASSDDVGILPHLMLSSLTLLNLLCISLVDKKTIYFYILVR